MYGDFIGWETKIELLSKQEDSRLSRWTSIHRFLCVLPILKESFYFAGSLILVN